VPDPVCEPANTTPAGLDTIDGEPPSVQFRLFPLVSVHVEPAAFAASSNSDGVPPVAVAVPTNLFALVVIAGECSGNCPSATPAAFLAAFSSQLHVAPGASDSGSVAVIFTDIRTFT
jgi:hypothetical protein